jgi:protein-L-isoaspartate O-methyltransferase
MHSAGPFFIAAVAFTFGLTVGSERSQRNIWERQYADRSAEAMAAQFENPSRPVFRHRADIVALLDLRPGMAVAEIGAGSGFLSRLIAQQVGPNGRVIATELDDKMVSYMNRRAAKEGITNFTAVPPGHSGFLTLRHWSRCDGR